MTKEHMGQVPMLKTFEDVDYHFDTELSKTLREEGIQFLDKLPIPTRKDEYWKYTPVNSWVNSSFKAGEAKEHPVKLPDNMPVLQEIPKLVFHNGYYISELSDTVSGLEFIPLSEAKSSHNHLLEKWFGRIDHAEEEVFTAVNRAYHNDGYFCYLTKGASATVQIIYLSDNHTISNPRNFLLAEAESKLSILETHYSKGIDGAFANPVTEYFIEKQADVNVTRLQLTGETSGLISNEYGKQEEGATFTINTYSIGGKTVRNNIHIDQNGPYTHTNLFGCYTNKGKGLIDNHTLINHRFPASESNELYKGVMDEQSTGVFNGKVKVWQDAQQTNAFQANHNILLSDNATVDSKPELEIYADDVKCSHGSTTGQIDEEAIFYLQARGIRRENAIRLLLSAFVLETTTAIADEAIKDLIGDQLETALSNDN